MQWSVQQERAILAVHNWLHYGTEQVFRLFGYAGTGKTEMAKHFAQGVRGTVLFAAYTGKAAHVLQQRGCLGASTIHSLIYQPKEKGRAYLKTMEAELVALLMKVEPSSPDSEISKKTELLKKEIEAEKQSLSQPSFYLNPDSPVRNAKLVIIDECSMVNEQMGLDMLSFGTKVLVLGDPAQLPPIYGNGFFTNHEPDIMLEEIHRQAADNPIIHLATLTRQQKPLPVGIYGASEVCARRMEPADALAADQVLVGRNATRRSCNTRMRELLSLTNPLPLGGDKLVCLRNDHGVGLLNGAMWNVASVEEYAEDNITMTITAEENKWSPMQVVAHKYPFLGPAAAMPEWWDRNEAEEFDYGYALTVHKSQGSQWENVMLFDESYCFRADRWRWLYTGITRAARRITVVRL